MNLKLDRKLVTQDDSFGFEVVLMSQFKDVGSPTAAEPVAFFPVPLG